MIIYPLKCPGCKRPFFPVVEVMELDTKYEDHRKVLGRECLAVSCLKCRTIIGVLPYDKKLKKIGE